jgi:hypothetical protein
MKGYLYEYEIVRYENHVRQSSSCMELWLPDVRILVSWVLGGTNLQITGDRKDVLGREKVGEVTVPYRVVRALRNALDQQQARTKASELLVLAAKQSEQKLRNSLRSLGLPSLE